MSYRGSPTTSSRENGGNTTSCTSGNQYLYFGTSKASTFVLVKQVNGEDLYTWREHYLMLLRKLREKGDRNGSISLTHLYIYQKKKKSRGNWL